MDEDKVVDADDDGQNVGFRVDRALLARFDEEVERRHLKRSGVIRWAMEEWLNKHGQAATAVNPKDR